VFVRIRRRGTLTIPSEIRRKVGIKEGDVVEVELTKEGVIELRKVKDLDSVRKMVEGRLPQWSELEGAADKLLLKEMKN